MEHHLYENKTCNMYPGVYNYYMKLNRGNNNMTKKILDEITKLKRENSTNERRLKELEHEKNLTEGEFEFEVRIRNVIYETRTVHANSEEEAEEKVQEDLDNFNPHVEEDDCDGAEIEEVNEI